MKDKGQLKEVHPDSTAFDRLGNISVLHNLTNWRQLEKCTLYVRACTQTNKKVSLEALVAGHEIYYDDNTVAYNKIIIAVK